MTLQMRLRKRRLAWPLASVFVTLLGAPKAGARQAASPTAGPEAVRELKQELAALRAQMDVLTARINAMEQGNTAEPAWSGNAPTTLSSCSVSGSSMSATSGVSSAKPSGSESESFLHGTTFNVLLDGYYEYNFNRPVGRVNLLRAYDVSSNSFSLNQAAILIERPASLEEGRPFGVRFDLQFGQATETLQGSAANELRPQVYRDLFQVYGTYITPLGSGLTIDFGKWSSALGFENNYGKDQFNYSRSYLFNFLPFYHMGLRASYQLTPSFSLAYWLVNGAQQTEDFNGFKSQAFLLTIKPTANINWNLNYYFGQEQRDVLPMLNPEFPVGPTQPGLPAASVSPVPNGREHILDTYATWNVTPRLTLAGEADYVLNRALSSSPATRVSGGAAYAHYQLAPRIALTARAEYLSDRGGLFSGLTQALKETTITTEYKLAEGFLTRFEWRRDFSNQPFFLTETPGLLKKEQNSAAVGLIWWWGQKQGPW